MEKTLQERNMDESFKRPGSVPFEWEIQPGIPKPHHTDSNNRSSESLTKLSPPPCMTSPSPSQSPAILYSTQSAISRSSFSQSTTLFYRSASDLQSKRRVHLAVRSSRGRVNAPQVTAVPPGCFQMAMLKRKDDKVRVISHNIDVIYTSMRPSSMIRISHTRPFGKSLSSREALAGTSRWFF